MRRKRFTGPKSYHLCRVCGAPYPSKYECGCAESALIRRVFDVFPGAVEIDEGEMRLLQRGSGYSGDDSADDPPF